MTSAHDWTWVKHWTDLLDQDEVWRDAQGTIHRLDDMEPGYCGRVRAFILRQASDVYDLIGMQLSAAPTDMSESAAYAFDRAFDEFLDAGDSPSTWLEGHPLLEALKNRSAGLPARHEETETETETEEDQHRLRRPAVDVDVVQRDQDPFGPYEYVEAGDRCIGAEGECLDRKCTQRRSTCRCLCPACVGDTPDVGGLPVY
ncbi:hypothetical protein [Streptomyces sp. 8L]|uniref:hypothetical protein n=1 Tax=Streptomyces sp. 8L TaxID=2877242 RepID=UPI001CD6FC7D|nr:hypothetical protein [Streptomyces sp. 8L]MCA1224249.1 hypothetical protein [Streptomyces sp. 8L]